MYICYPFDRPITLTFLLPEADVVVLESQLSARLVVVGLESAAGPGEELSASFGGSGRRNVG